MRRARQSGQATVEFALILPLLLALVVLILQVAMVARAQVLVVQAAREGARSAAVEGDIPAAKTAAYAATGLEAARVKVVVVLPAARDGTVVVATSYSLRIGMSLLGINRVVEVHSSVAMRREYS